MKHYIFVLLIFILASCQGEDNLLQGFKPCNKLIELGEQVDKDDLGLVEGLQSNDSLLITLDFHHSKSYSLFRVDDGKILTRFGEIGNGHLEIPMGCIGSIYLDKFVAFDDERSMIATYKLSLDSSLVACNSIRTYKIPNAQFSRIIPVANGEYIGMGNYKDKYQYVLFDSLNDVLDSGYELYNADNEELNTYQKFLSNQGALVKHPHKPLFVGTVRHSSNIDIFEIDKGKISKIKSYRLGNPSYSTMQIMGLSRVIPTDDAINGFLDVCATDKYIYALYSEDNLKKSPYRSRMILVFDWDGNKVCKLDMPNDIYYISANSKKVFTAEKDNKGHFVIKGYQIQE